MNLKYFNLKPGVYYWFKEWAKVGQTIFHIGFYPTKTDLVALILTLKHQG